jgi:endonuclease/exonuclease/phosphatase (EEP) superfamily protein YafD
MRRLARGIAMSAACIGLAALAGGFAGLLHPAGDSLAVFRLPIAAAVVAAALALALLGGRRWLAAGLGALALLAAAPAAWRYLPPGPVPGPGAAEATAGTAGFRGVLYQKNLLFSLEDPTALIADIRASGADFVTLQEVTPQNRILLDTLAEDYPAQLFCPFSAVWPAMPGEAICTQAGGLSALRVDAPGGPLWVVSVHLHWPWPYGQQRQARHLSNTLEAISGRMIVGGDFNMVPWGWSVWRLGRAAEAVPAGPAMTTFRLAGGLVGLPIDHVLLPAGWRGRVERRPLLGSDHYGLVARFEGAP